MKGSKQTSLALGSGISAGIESYPCNIKVLNLLEQTDYQFQSQMLTDDNTSGLISLGSSMYSLSSQSAGCQVNESYCTLWDENTTMQADDKFN